MICRKDVSHIVGKKIVIGDDFRWIREKAIIVARARYEEYENRRPGLSKEKVFMDLLNGFLGEYAVWSIVKSSLDKYQISDYDFELHQNNKHGYDFWITKECETESVSVKTSVAQTKRFATWTYQTDKLPMDESLHFLVFGYQPCDSFDASPSVFEVLAVESSSRIRELLKEMKRPAGGKKAVYFEDLRSGN